MELQRKIQELHKELGNKLTVEQVTADLEVEKAMRKEAHGKIAALKEEKKKLEKKLKKISEICVSEKSVGI
jgi:hypothetical protein